MKSFSEIYQGYDQEPSKEPRFIVQISWDDDDTDYTYLTSSSNANLPDGALLESGATTLALTNGIIDSAATFITNGVIAGDKATNLDTLQETNVTSSPAVETVVYVDDDYFYNGGISGVNYEITRPVDSINNSVLKISGQTQKINPDIATSTIGAITIELSDVTDDSVSPILENQITTRMNTKLVAGDGLRGKVIRAYVGYGGMEFADYDLKLTYIIDSVSFKDGIYKINASDIQRSTKHKIFTPDETTLNSSITADDLIIPVVSIDTSLFPAVTHGAEFDVLPGDTVAYIKIENEVITHQGGISFDTTNGWHITALERGALNTMAAKHDVTSDTEDKRKPKILEHVYIEGAAPKIMYALLTGVLLNGNSPEDTLPDHWNLGISTSFVRLSDFQGIGLDLWDTLNDSGRRVRIENPGTQDGKKYIEKEMLLWMGCFMPIYSTGELGIKKLAGILSDSAWNAILNKYNIVSYGDLTHDMRAVINDIRVDWNWVDSKELFTKKSLFIDSGSITAHGIADTKDFAFSAVHVGLHTDEDLLTYFDVLRDRYSGPPLLLQLKILPTMSKLEVGDTVKVQLDQIRDFNNGSTLDRTFEVQQVTTDWMSGAISLKIFGSSQKAGALDRTTLSTVLLDTFYTQAGTDLAGSPSPLTIVAGAVTVGGTLTGHASDVDNAVAIYYYDGDLTINAGVTVSLTENVQLRIKGHLTINGAIEGVAAGAIGATATTKFTNGTTTYSFANSGERYRYSAYFDVNESAGGYYGITVASVGVHPEQVSVFNDYPIFGYKIKTTQAGAAFVPHSQLVNNQQTNALTGLTTKNLKGIGGISGSPLIYMPIAAGAGSLSIQKNSGAGGDGGAGLLIVCRGISFGGSGEIDLSGGDSTVNSSSYSYNGNLFYAGAGAPGAPGALIILLDGDQTNPDITSSNFIANYGDAPKPAGATETGQEYRNTLPVNGTWPLSSCVGNGEPYPAKENVSESASAHRVQYIPEDETPVYDAQDESLFPELSTDAYTETKILTETAPGVANQKFGTDAAITSTGERMIVAAQRAGATASCIHLIRGAINPFIEQTIAAPDGELNTFGESVAINEDGDRVFASNQLETITALANAGAVYIYTRSGTTWALEQKLTAPTPAANNYFGQFVVWNKDNDKMLVIDNVYTNQKIHYYTRSGTTWIYQNSLTPPGGETFEHIGNAAMSPDGNWFMTANELYNDGSDTTGKSFVYQLSGSAWSHVKTLIPKVGAGYHYGTASAINVDGAALAVSANGFASGPTDNVAIYHRIGTDYKLLQIIEASASGDTRFGRWLRLSNDGLLLYIVEDIASLIHVYRRTNIAQAFKHLSIHADNDAATLNLFRVANSPDGSKMLISNRGSDIVAANTGGVRIWELLRK